MEIRDKRSKFFEGYFNKGLSFSDYLATGTDAQQNRWTSYLENIQLTKKQHELFSGFTRKMNVLVLSGIWCGDCARQVPMLQRFEEASSVMTFRYLDNKENPELQDELRIQGGTRVPTVVTLSEDFFEISRFGDRTLSAYRRKAANELGPACDPGIAPPKKEELEEEVADWSDHFERLQLILRLSPFLRKRYGD